MKDTDVAWLAGILDGEGMICFSRRGRKPNPQVRLAVKATCIFMIDKVSTILRELDVNYTYSIEDRSSKPGHRSVVRIQVVSLGGVEKVLHSCLEYLTTKKSEAVVMLDYICWRYTLPGTMADPELRKTLRIRQELTMQELQRLKRLGFIPEVLVAEPNQPLKVVTKIPQQS